MHSGSSRKVSPPVQPLFNSTGRHVANLASREIYSLGGGHLGHQLQANGVIVDLSGDYLGSVVNGNRLLRQRPEPQFSVNRLPPSSRNLPDYGRRTDIDRVALQEGWHDVDRSRLDPKRLNLD